VRAALILLAAQHIAEQLFGNNQAGSTGSAGTIYDADGNAIGTLSDIGLNHDHDNDTMTADRYNMVIKALGGTWTLGRQEASWGNKFLGWGSNVDRIKYVTKAGGMTVGGYLQKSSEDVNGVNGNDGDGDKDIYAALVIGKAGDTKWGVLANYLYNDTKRAVPGGGASEDGYLVDVFVNSKAGPASIMGEFVYSGGDAGGNKNLNAATDPDPESYFGGFVGAAMNMDAMTVKGLIAYYDGNMGGVGGRDCDNDFAPSLLIGTCNETAIIDFGETTGSDADSTYLIGAGVDFKVNDKLTLGGLIGYLMATEEGGLPGTTIDVSTNDFIGSTDGTLLELDFTAKYALAQNATYSFGIAYGMTDDLYVNNIAGVDTVTDDDIIVIGHRVDVQW